MKQCVAYTDGRRNPMRTPSIDGRKVPRSVTFRVLAQRRVRIALISTCFGLLGLGNANAQNDAQSLGQDANQQAYDLLRHFGVGLSLTHDFRGEERIEEAQIVDGIVRVTKDSNTRARVMLEWHAWMLCEHLEEDEVVTDPPYRSVRRPYRQSDGDEANAGGGNTAAATRARRRERVYWKQEPPCLPTRRASGAFVAVQPGSDAIIDAIGLGWMFRLPDKLQMFGNRTLNIGFGLVADQNVKVLGDGFVENEPPPMGTSGTLETQVRYRTTTQGGIFAMASLELGQTPTTIPQRSFYTNLPADAKPAVNDSVNFYWSFDGLDKCVASGAWNGEKAPKGEEQFKLTTAGNQRFTLECTGEGRSVSRFVEIDVVGAPPAQPAAGQPPSPP